MRKKKISLTIDGTPVTVDEGTTIMEACEQLGIHIPRLCYHADLRPHGVVPRVHRRGEGHGLLHDFLQPTGLGRNGGPNQFARHPPGAARHRRAAAGQPSEGLPDLRARRELRVAGSRLFDGCAGAPFRGQAKTLPHRHLQPLGRPRQREVRALRPLRAGVCRDPGRPQPQPAWAGIQHGSSLPPTRPRWTIPSVSSAGQCINVCPTAAFVEKRGGRRRLGRHRQPRPARGRPDRPLDPGPPSARVSAFRRALRPRARWSAPYAAWDSTPSSIPTSAPT